MRSRSNNGWAHLFHEDPSEFACRPCEFACLSMRISMSVNVNLLVCQCESENPCQQFVAAFQEIRHGLSVQRLVPEHGQIMYVTGCERHIRFTRRV